MLDRLVRGGPVVSGPPVGADLSLGRDDVHSFPYCLD